MRTSTIVVSVTIILAACSKGPAGDSPPPGSRTNKPPQTATTSGNPVTISPLLSNGRYLLAQNVPMHQQLYFYDSETRRAITPDGPDLKLANSPIPMRILSFNPAKFGGGACAIYRNVLIDLKNLQKEKELPFSLIHVNDDAQLIEFATVGRRQILIDDNYVVFPDDARTVSPAGPFVTLVLRSLRFNGTEYKQIPSIRGVIKRDTGREQPFETGEDGEAHITLNSAEETAVTAIVSDGKGEQIEMPVPLPMKGAERGLVRQWVFLRFGKPKAQHQNDEGA